MISYWLTGKTGSRMSVLCWTWSERGAGKTINWPVLDGVMGVNSIWGNRTPWRKRGFFSHQAGHMDFMMWTVLISSTPADSCIWREAAVLLCTSCLSDKRGRPRHRSRRSWAAVPARSPAFFLLLHFFQLIFYGMQRCCLYGFCLPGDRSDVSAHSVRCRFSH